MRVDLAFGFPEIPLPDVGVVDCLSGVERFVDAFGVDLSDLGELREEDRAELLGVFREGILTGCYEKSLVGSNLAIDDPPLDQGSSGSNFVNLILWAI